MVSGFWMASGTRLTVTDTPQEITIQVQQDRNCLTAIKVTRAGQMSAIMRNEYSLHAWHRAKRSGRDFVEGSPLCFQPHMRVAG